MKKYRPDRLVPILILALLLGGCRSLDVDSYIKEKPQSSSTGQTADTQTTADSEEEEPETATLSTELAVLNPTAITASTTLSDSGNMTYEPRNVNDNNLNTCWSEGADGDGEGQYLEFSFPEGTVITGGVIYPAYYKSSKVFKRNPGVNAIEITGGGVTVTVDTSDGAKKYSSSYEGLEFTLEEPITCDGKIRVTISEIRKGSKYSDASISELHFTGYPLLGQNEETDLSEESAVTEVVSEEIQDAATWQLAAAGASRLIAWSLGGDLASEAVTIKAATLTASERAFLLYWYQYEGDDMRFAFSGSQYHTADRDTLLEVMKGLAEGAADKDVDRFIHAYTEDEVNGTYYMNASGDFGDAGNFYFDNVTNQGISDGLQVLTGDVMVYNSKKDTYEAKRTFTIRLVSAEDGVFDGWRYRQIEISKESSKKK